MAPSSGSVLGAALALACALATPGAVAARLAPDPVPAVAGAASSPVAASGPASSSAAPSWTASSPSAAANAQELRAWLQRVHDAATRSNYVGTLVNWAGGTVTSTRVTHYADARGEVEKVEALDGEPRGMLRVGDQVRTVWPSRHVAVVQPRDPRAAFPSLVTGGEQRIPEFYELQVLRPQRLAGHDADRVLLKARDGIRFDEMVWTDHASGLLLRVDVQTGNRTLESSAFSDVSIGVKPQPELIFEDLRRTNAFRVVTSSVDRTQLDAEGWRLKGALPAGFQVLGCVRRLMPSGSGDAPDAHVVQAIFTDGLTHVSVFIEPWQRRHPAPGLSVIGATHTMTRRVNDDWLTAVGDVPPTTLEQFLLVLERSKR